MTTENARPTDQAPSPAKPTASSASGTAAVEARGLTKTFGTNRAVDGIDLTVMEGEIFGVLGPNGAGKTTMLNMLATLLPIDSGEARIFGYDVRSQGHAVRQLIGVTGQYASVDENLTARENLWMFGRLQGLSSKRAHSIGDDLLAQFDLTEAAHRPISQFSGGMRRRLDLAASLITRPALIFLDEPTTGLDPRNRSQMWDTIRDLVAEGSTILLTTQYLDEADALAGRIAVIDRGRKVAEGTPAELKSKIGASSLRVQMAEGADRADGDRVGCRADQQYTDRFTNRLGIQRPAEPRERGCRRSHRAPEPPARHHERHRRTTEPRRGVHGPDRPPQRNPRPRKRSEQIMTATITDPAATSRPAARTVQARYPFATRSRRSRRWHGAPS